MVATAIANSPNVKSPNTPGLTRSGSISGVSAINKTKLFNII